MSIINTTFFKPNTFANTYAKIIMLKCIYRTVQKCGGGEIFYVPYDHQKYSK